MGFKSRNPSSNQEGLMLRHFSTYQRCAQRSIFRRSPAKLIPRKFRVHPKFEIQRQPIKLNVLYVEKDVDKAVRMKPESPFPWTKTKDQLEVELNVNVAHGLSEQEVKRRQEIFGFNELAKQEKTPLWQLLLQQFDDTLVKILLGSAFVSFALAYFDEGSQAEGLRAYVEPFVILLILLLNAAVDIWQESRSEAALEALKELQGEQAMVLRGGAWVSDLPAKDLVPGDIVALHAGDRVPADIRILALRTATVRAEQASLTGESVGVSKDAAPLHDAECELQAKENMVFSGTAISTGILTGVVTSIGMDTEIGKIQDQIQEAADSAEGTPLQKKLDEFSELLAQVIFFICVAVWLINYKNFLSFEPLDLPGLPLDLPDPSTVSVNFSSMIYYLKTAIALAVAAIPEGLPAVITTCLALGTRRLAEKQAIVRKLPSVETLGCTTVISSDKTGTLTTNQMSVVQLSAVADARSLRSWEVEGQTYNAAEGQIKNLEEIDSNLQAVCEVCALCTESRLEYKNGALRCVGVPTEAALKVLVEKLGAKDSAAWPQLQQLRADLVANPEPVCASYQSKWTPLSLLEFDRNRKSMSVLARSPRGRNVLQVKGAAECVLERSNRIMLPDGSIEPMSAEMRGSVLKVIEGMADSALRCLAMAQKVDLGVLSDYDGGEGPGQKLLADPDTYTSIESDLVFLGLAGLQDPPRPEVVSAILECREAGIRVMVITGDNKRTAEAICRKIGVLGDDGGMYGSSFTGREFSEMAVQRKKDILRSSQGCVFSRAEPRHKQDIVRLLKEMDEVTAMTGDGVNDAPALKQADIGISMGITGTEVAKEASDMVLADDNFSTIVSAVSEGRAIYNNMKAFIRYMISSNLGEVSSIFISAAIGLPLAFLPVQLLWVNLVTDGPPATALGFNPPDEGIMRKPPRRSDEALISPWVFFRFVAVGAYVGIAAIGAFSSWYMFDHFAGIDLSRDGHTAVSWEQLTHWQACSTWPSFQATPYTAGDKTFVFSNACDYFTDGRAKAVSLALSTIVTVEMFNALNAVSEDLSIVSKPPWTNRYLLLAIGLSTGLHCMILYVPFLSDIFNVVPLSWEEWQLVLLWSFPVILLEEFLKLLARSYFGVRDVKTN